MCLGEVESWFYKTMIWVMPYDKLKKVATETYRADLWSMGPQEISL